MQENQIQERFGGIPMETQDYATPADKVPCKSWMTRIQCQSLRKQRDLEASCIDLGCVDTRDRRGEVTVEIPVWTQ